MRRGAFRVQERKRKLRRKECSFLQQEGEQEKAGWRPGTVRPRSRDFQPRKVDDFKTIESSPSGCVIC